MTTTRKAFGSRLERAYKDAKLTRAAFAREIRVGYNTVWRYEKGENFPSLDVLSAIAGVIGTDAFRDLFEGLDLIALGASAHAALLLAEQSSKPTRERYAECDRRAVRRAEALRERDLRGIAGALGMHIADSVSVEEIVSVEEMIGEIRAMRAAATSGGAADFPEVLTLGKDWQLLGSRTWRFDVPARTPEGTALVKSDDEVLRTLPDAKDRQRGLHRGDEVIR